MKEYNPVCAEIMYQARIKHNVSLAQMSADLNVSRQTISSWETGKSEPSMSQAFRWFEILGENPMLFVLAYVHPDRINNNGTPRKNDIKAILHNRIDSMTTADAEKLLFVLNGLSGSHPRGILDLLTAYSHLPLLFKVISSKSLLTSYLTAESLGMLIDPAEAVPDIEFLKEVIIKASEALSSGKESYL